MEGDTDISQLILALARKDMDKLEKRIDFFGTGEKSILVGLSFVCNHYPQLAKEIKPRVRQYFLRNTDVTTKDISEYHTDFFVETEGCTPTKTSTLESASM